MASLAVLANRRGRSKPAGRGAPPLTHSHCQPSRLSAERAATVSSGTEAEAQGTRAKAVGKLP